MATLINNSGVQHYANKMVQAENRKIGSNPLPSVLNDIDTKIDEFKTLFEEEYGSALDIKLSNNENIFSVGQGIDIDKRSDVENGFTDVEISGNTMVNLWDSSKGFQHANSNTRYVRPNTKYTIIVKGVCGTTVGQINYRRFKESGGYGDACMKVFSANETSIAKTVITTNSDDIALGVYSPSNILSLSELIILEGDWINREVPKYFEGMKSVGEKEDGNYKIKTLSENENIWKGKEIYYPNNCKIIQSSDNEIVFESTSVNQGIKFNIQRFKNKKLSLSYDLEVLSGKVLNFGGHNRHYDLGMYVDGAKKGTYHNGLTMDYEIGKKYRIEVILSIDDNVGQYGSSYDVKDRGEIGIEPNRYTAENPQTCCVKVSNFVLKEIENYTIPTIFTTPKFDEKEIPLTEPLRGLSDGTKDTIEKINGEWKIIRRCGEIILDDKLNWRLNNTENTALNTNRFIAELPSNKGEVAPYPFVGICDVLPIYKHWSDTAHLGVTLANPKTIFVYKKEFSNATDFTNWIKDNPAKVIYKLATPIIEDIEPVTLQYWENGSISIDEILPVETTHTVSLNKPAQIKRNIEELTSLKNRVKALEDFYDQVALEQAYQLDLINHSFELDYK